MRFLAVLAVCMATGHALLDDLMKGVDDVLDGVHKAADELIDGGLDVATKVGEAAGHIVDDIKDKLEQKNGPAAKEKCFIQCPRMFDPVCGSDGETYAHECLMRTAACEKGIELTMVHEGECNEEADDSERMLMEVDNDRLGCDMVCSLEYMPVCGSNGQTYPNACVLRIAACIDSDVTLAHEGPCAGDNCNVMCTAQWQPVCGSDGMTYSNMCDLHRAVCHDRSLKFLQDGECPETDSLANSMPQDVPTSYIMALCMSLAGVGMFALGVAMLYVARNRALAPPIYSELGMSMESAEIDEVGPVPFDEKPQAVAGFMPVGDTKVV